MNIEQYHELRKDLLWDLLAPDKAKAIVKKLDLALSQSCARNVFAIVIDLKTEHDRGELTDEQFQYEIDRVTVLADQLLTDLHSRQLINDEELAVLQNALYFKPIKCFKQIKCFKPIENQTKSNETVGGQDNAVQEQ